MGIANKESQPNSALFENFDRLLLLQRGGETVYFGEIGKDAAVRNLYYFILENI